MTELADRHAILGNALLRESNALHEYQEYVRLDPDDLIAPGVRQMIETFKKIYILRQLQACVL